jgi:membrane associated rhomboid family serine protease
MTHPFQYNRANESEKRMQKLFADLTSEQADLCGLILSSSGIAYTVARTGDRWEIWVRQKDGDRAISKIKEYFRENPEGSTHRFVPPHRLTRTYTGIYAAFGLMLLHWMIYYHNVKPTFVDSFGANTRLILEGETFRAVTALMLHSDLLHLMGNMVGIAIFGTAVCSITRPGLGWLLILFSGILGNMVNAALRGPGHLSIGASTAVFGAIGILSAIQFWRKFKEPGQRLRAWLPLAGGIALLAILGTGGGRTDLMAHLLGLAAGLLLGSGYGILIQQPIQDKYQKLCWCVTVLVLMVAWFH